MENNLGWIRLHRKLMDSPDWLAEPFTRGQAWVDLLLLANHREGFIRRRGVLVAVERGQVGYSEDALAARWKWSKGKVRRFLSELARLSRVSRKISEKTVLKKTSVSNLIYIINYDKYQTNGNENGTEDGPKTVMEQEGKEGKENTPDKNLSEKILELKSRYPNQEIIDQVFEALSSTRKSNRLADSVILGILQSWNRYPVESVIAGIQIYLQRDYAGQGRNEKYLLGIIRGQKSEANNPQGQATRSTGSALLDRYYKERGAYDSA